MIGGGGGLPTSTGSHLRTPNRDHPPSSGPFSTNNNIINNPAAGLSGVDEYGRQFPDEMDGIRVAGDDLHGGPTSSSSTQQHQQQHAVAAAAAGSLSSSSFPPQPLGAAPPRPQPQGAPLGGGEGQLPGHGLSAGGVGGVGVGVGGVGVGSGMGLRMADARTLNKGAGGIPQIEITNDGHETLGGGGMPGGSAGVGMGINGGGRVPPIDGEYAYQNGGELVGERGREGGRG